MKGAVLVIVLCLALSTLSPPVEAQPADYWTGFYAGLNAGYGWGNHAIELSGDPLTEAVIGLGVLPRALADDPSGGLGGAQVGYNHRVRWFVLGAEADFQGADISSKQTASPVIPPFFPFTTVAEQDLEFLGTVRARVGVAPWPALLLYGTGGLAYGGVSLSASSTNPGCIGVCASASRSGVETGWTVGGGVEYGFAGRWSVKAEYLHYDLGTVSVDVVDPRFPALIQTFRADFQGHIARFGVNYRF